ncbi:MAG: penicillin-binding protein 2 [candidate division WOR-3 bacterium]
MKIILSVIFCIIALYVFYLETFEAKQYEQMAESQHTFQLPLLAERGKIFDCQDRPIVYNQMTASIRILPQYVRPSAIDSVANLLAQYNLKPKNEILHELRTRRSLYWFKKNIDYQVACSLKQKLRKCKFDNSVIVADAIRRIYPFSEILASVTGFVGDEAGLAGIEYRYDSILKGTEGYIVLQKDASGNNFAWSSYPTKKPINGQDIVLTINLDIQDIAYRELANYVNRFKALRGQVIVLNAQDAALLALAEYPDYDPHQPTQFSQELWKAASISDEFEPGSVYKLLICATALESPNRDLLINQKYDVSNGFITISGKKIKDVHNNGILDFPGIFIKSSNIGVSLLSQLVSPKDFFLKQREFGFGMPTGIELPGEAAGYIDKPANLKPLRFANIAFGQGVRVTLLQLAMAYLSIANDGELLKPYLVKEIRNQNKVVMCNKRTVVRRVLSSENAQIIKEILAGVVNQGTGRAAALSGFQVCGKTGTAQKIEPNGTYSATRSVMTFIGFFPKENPKYLIAVMIDEPKISRFAGEVTCPLYRSIAEQIIQLDNPHYKPNANLLTMNQ